MKRAATPEQLHQLFAEALNAGDVNALASLYADDACLSPRPAECARGPSQIHALLTSYCDAAMKMRIATRRVTIAGDIALLMSDWRVTRIAPDGSVVDASGNSVEVARRGPDGAWRYLIDHPHGLD